MVVPIIDYTEEERKLRLRMAERGLKVNDIAEAVGIHRQDVTAVLRGRSRSPRYVEAVYNFLGVKPMAL